MRTVDEIKQLVIFMKEQGAYKFAIGDVSVEFGIGITANSMPSNIDDETERAAELRKILSAAVDDQAANELWSV